MDVVKLWEKIKKIMKKRVNEGEFELFFENVEATKLEESVFTLTCNSKLIKENMEKYKIELWKTWRIKWRIYIYIFEENF